MYTVKGLLDRPTEITFSKEELQKVTKPEIFRVEQILEKKKCGHQMYYKVQWKGYSKDFDAWLMKNIRFVMSCKIYSTPFWISLPSNDNHAYVS